jgi:hypothetical protein
MAKTNADVSTPSLAYNEMASPWNMIHALLGSTQAMRDAGETYLPIEPKEERGRYELRRDRSFLYGALSNTIDKVVSKPFSKPTATRGELSEDLAIIEDDVDREGKDLTQFARECFRDMATYGKTHILVDHPTVGENITLEEQRKLDLRPIFLCISPPDLIAWTADVPPEGGKRELTSIRIQETQTEAAGPYEEEEVNYVRVITKSEWELHRQVEDGSYIRTAGGPHSLGKVALVTVYANEKKFMVSEPPLLDLAWLNVAHWQTSSDLRNLSRIAMAATLLATGFKESELDSLIIGPNQLWKSRNPDADAKFVEHTGAAIEIGNKTVERLEEQMEVLGLQPLIARTNRSTATGKVLDESRSSSDIQSWVRSLENGLVQAYELAAEWIKEELPEDFAVDVFSDFSLAMLSDSDIIALLKMRQQGEVTRKTLLHEAKRRGILSDAVDVEQELVDLEEEMQSSMALPDDEENDDDDDEEETNLPEEEEKETPGEEEEEVEPLTSVG